MKKFIIAAALLTAGTASAKNSVEKILAMLPQSMYQGNNCQIYISPGPCGTGVSIHLTNFTSTNTMQTWIAIDDEKCWAKKIVDRSTGEKVDLRVKNRRGNDQRLIIEEQVVTIQEYIGGKAYESICDLN